MYDSTKDATSHIKKIQYVFNELIIPELEKRAIQHDQSKLESPEKECYDKYIPLLRTAKYGTLEYQKIRDAMAKEGLEHHFKVNRHHPEHFKNQVNDMNIVDFVEMFCDWVAASMVSDTTFLDGLKSNQKRFNLSDDIIHILENGYNDLIAGHEDEIKKIS